MAQFLEAKPLHKRLNELSKQTLDELSVFRALLSREKPDLARVSTARARLASLRLSHGIVIKDLLNYVGKDRRCPPHFISSRRDAYQNILTSAVRHTTRWGPKEIAENWDEYRHQSMMLVAQWRHAIMSEKASIERVLEHQKAGSNRSPSVTF